MAPGLQDAQVFILIINPLLGPRLVVKEGHQGVLLGELVMDRGQLGLVVALGWGLVCHPSTGTWPAMNCPKPGGKVSVEMINVTRAGKSRRLAGWHRAGGDFGAAPAPTPCCWGLLGTYFFMRKRLMVFWRRMNCTILRLRKTKSAPPKPLAILGRAKGRGVLLPPPVLPLPPPGPWDGCWDGRTHPMTAKAGSSCRSKGKSRRKRVLNSAVIVSGE